MILNKTNNNSKIYFYILTTNYIFTDITNIPLIS